MAATLTFRQREAKTIPICMKVSLFILTLTSLVLIVILDSTKSFNSRIGSSTRTVSQDPDFDSRKHCGTSCAVLGNQSQSYPPHPPIQLCKPATSLVFLKTHKTGSTTISHILNHYGLSRNLSFMFYAHRPSGNFIFDNPRNASDISPPFGVKKRDFSHYRNYDMMTAHMRFIPNIKFLNRFMNPWARHVTILRHPVNQWESALFYFKCEKHLHIPGKKSADFITNFFKQPLSYWKTASGHCRHYTRNGMSFDLSSENDVNKSSNSFKVMLRDLDERLDLVLITEYMDESLILLRKMMCWDYEDILYVSANQRLSRSELSETQRAMIRQWNDKDILLYEYFNRTLWRKIEEYGTRFSEDLSHFREILRTYYDMCNIQSVNNKRKKKIDIRANNLTTFCRNLGMNSVTKILRRHH